MLACIALLSLGFLVSTELLIRVKVVPVDNLISHWRLFAGATNANTIFGDSHTSSGIHGLSGFINLSLPGEDVPTTEEKVRSYYADIRPGKVILQADPHRLVNRPSEYADRDKIPASATGQEPYLWLLTPLHRKNIPQYWRRFLAGITFEEADKFQPDGAITLRGSWMDLPKQERHESTNATVEGQSPAQEPSETRNARAYERILAYLTANGADVCMVRMPVSSVYREMSSSLQEFGSAQTFLRSLAHNYKVRYVDLSDAIKDDSLFFDTDHLNARGAAAILPLLEAGCIDSSVHTESGGSEYGG